MHKIFLVGFFAGMFQAEIVTENAAFLVEGGLILPGSSDGRRQKMSVPPCATTVTCNSDRESAHWNNMIATDPGGFRTKKNSFVHPRNPGEGQASASKKTKKKFTKDTKEILVRIQQCMPKLGNTANSNHFKSIMPFPKLIAPLPLF